MTDTPTIVRERLTGTQAWRGEDLTPKDYLYELSGAETAAFRALRDDLDSRQISLGQIGPDTVPIPGLEAAAPTRPLVATKCGWRSPSTPTHRPICWH